MRPETVTMAMRFLDAAFGGDVKGETDERGLVVTVRYLGIAHEVVVAPDLLDLEPTAIMASLRDVPPAIRREKTPVRVIVTSAGLLSEPQ